jgi:TatD DNase family protein
VIDTHAHLDALEDDDAAIARARQAGVTRVLTVGTTIDGCRRALELATRHEGVCAIVGIHPHEASSAEADRLEELYQLARDDRAVAVGETGLDYYRDYASPAQQQNLFHSQLVLAQEVGKPVVIHTRAADDDVSAALRRFEGTVVLHCFSSPALLRDALDRGWYVSFAGNVTYPKAQDLRDAAVRVPADRILAETDSPYLAPQPVRGRTNEPAYVVHTLATLAEVRRVEAAELEAQIEANAHAAFGLP